MHSERLLLKIDPVMDDQTRLHIVLQVRLCPRLVPIVSNWAS